MVECSALYWAPIFTLFKAQGMLRRGWTKRRTVNAERCLNETACEYDTLYSSSSHVNVVSLTRFDPRLGLRSWIFSGFQSTQEFITK